ncbi:MAG: SDR family NAD(P)-dependent oxidoreductase [Bacteroidetes bacterium]|nr:SDR family NAD(P)-dependent oxidoreductase [Bacteroidota bacterium]
MKVYNKTIVVTGAGGGIGQKLVLNLLSKGSKVVAIDINEKALAGTIDIAGDMKSNVVPFVADITNKEKVETLPAQIIAHTGSIDGLINNAGIMQPFKKLSQLEFSMIERVLNVNLFGTIFMTKAFLPHLLSRPEAHIVNISSMAGFMPLPGQSIYCASKAAVKILTEVLHSELDATNVQVTVVMPGGVDTDITKNAGIVIPKDMEDAQKSYKPLSPESAAEQIINGMEKNKSRILVGSDARIMDKLYRFRPSFAARLIYKQMKGLVEA